MEHLIIQTIDFLYDTPKAQKQSYLPIAFRMRGLEDCSRPTQAPV